jgi:excisionase family DNA binding protein
MIDLKKEPETLTIGRAAAALGLDRSTIARAINAGQLTAKQIGRRRYLLRDELLKFLGK